MANPSPTADRQNLRRVVVECRALVDALNELYPATRLPDLNATDREIGEWMGRRRLVSELNILLEEAWKPTAAGELPKVIRR